MSGPTLTQPTHHAPVILMACRITETLNKQNYGLPKIVSKSDGGATIWTVLYLLTVTNKTIVPSILQEAMPMERRKMSLINDLIIMN